MVFWHQYDCHGSLNNGISYATNPYCEQKINGLSSINLSLINLSKSNNKNEIIFEKQIDTELGVFDCLISQNTTVLYEQIDIFMDSNPMHTTEDLLIDSQIHRFPTTLNVTSRRS
ncbi:unnamed protein product [Rotaria magnacalcarata]|uniref:Uncharacterized protein n=1 Tax=Rotaria magnacalcarata TaxID=392030 RepID=A0A819KBX1_9BILA|nr:unnamed protein product [Rotaria magnacalcarata]